MVPGYFPLFRSTYFQPFAAPVQAHFARDAQGRAIGRHFDPVIHDLAADLPRLGKSAWGFDRDDTQQRLELAQDAFGDILPVRLTMGCLTAVLTQHLVHLMGMENMLLAMYDCPDELHALLGRLTEDQCAYYHWLESEGLLLPTCAEQPLDQGTYCFTSALPADRALHTTDVWGFMDSQETVDVSPDMFGEFFFPYYRRIAGCFGLLSYGCCEPVHPLWKPYIQTLPNLRRVSISPWCDEEYMGAALRGKPVVYHRKPSPQYLGVGDTLDEDGLREHIERTLRAARGCTLEITQRDVYTIHGDIPKARRFIEIIRDCIERHWE